MLLCDLFVVVFFFFKQKTAYEMRISDWSSDVCSSDPQPDLGTALAISIGGMVVMFVAGLPFWWFGSTAAAGIAALPILFSFLHDYQQKRVLILDRKSVV